MDGTAVKELERINMDHFQVERDGMLFSGKPLHPVYFEPRPAAVELHTLSGLVDFVKENIDQVDLAQSILMVDGPTSVSFVSRTSGYDCKRNTIAQAVLDQGLKTYEFGKYQQIEFFIVSLRSMFEPSPDIEKLIIYVSKIRGGKTFDLSDDGISQTATVQAGVHGALTKKETAPAIVKLRPYRTFRDIEQTESEFLFRMKIIDTEEIVVGACLYEADGGRWRNLAAVSIRNYLSEKMPEGPAVIA